MEAINAKGHAQPCNDLGWSHHARPHAMPLLKHGNSNPTALQTDRGQPGCQTWPYSRPMQCRPQLEAENSTVRRGNIFKLVAICT